MKTEVEFIKRLTHPKHKEKAFVELLDLYQERLYWHIRKLVISHEDADDVLQNTFVRVYKSIAKFKQQSSLHTWMFRIAYNESVRHLEKNKKRQTTDSLEQKHLESLVSTSYFDGEEAKVKLTRAVYNLPEKKRRVFQMKYYDDLKFKEIAEILELKENTLKTIYYSAIKSIEKDMLVLTPSVVEK